MPAERTEDYQRFQNMRRKQAGLVVDGMRAMLGASVAGYAAVHSLGGIVPIVPVRWAVLLTSIAVWLWMMATFVRGERAVDHALAELPPAAMAIDWRKNWWSFGAFMAGLAVLLIWPW